ncbi:hypothetical protein [Halomonas sp. GD1P12]|uniref:hypothetical protein n=1 Tax=Halomonas sp. GD1P12 TaxID=2982691 RepID=UPI0021E37087|nr:hypothetical protein [Halomonas sp. GD1P12]UYG00242.1 hypothetical protein OCT39_01430 [Halomonas sp. GD1P12]
MPAFHQAPSLNELVLRIIPNLNQADTLVLNTLESLIESASDPLEVLRRKEQKQQFALEIYRLRLGLEGVLERYRDDVNALIDNDNHRSPPLSFKPGEEAVIRDAIAIYDHVRAFQRGERAAPIPR